MTLTGQYTQNVAPPPPARSLDSRKPSLKRKLEDDEAAEPKQLEHPHKLVVRGTRTACERLGICVHIYCGYVHIYDSHDLPPPPVSLRAAVSLSTSAMRPPRVLIDSNTQSIRPYLKTLESARGLDAVRPTTPPRLSAHRRRRRARRPPRPQIRVPLKTSTRYRAVRMQLSLCSVVWRTLRALEVESELDAYKLDGLKALLLLHLQAAAFVSFVAFLGVLRVQQSPHVRLYRDCSVPFAAFLTLLAMYLTFSPIALPASLDTLLDLLPNLFSSASSSSSSGSSAYARRSDGAGAASMNPLRLACDQPELAGLLALTAPGEACERRLKRAAVSVSAGMLHFLLAVSTHYAHMLCSSPSAPTPSADGADAEQGAAPLSTLSTLSTPTPMHIFPLLPHLSPNDVGALSRSIHDAVGDKSAYGKKKEEGSSLVSRATEVWVSATRPSAGTCAKGLKAGRDRRVEGREGRADAGLLDAGVVGRSILFSLTDPPHALLDPLIHIPPVPHIYTFLYIPSIVLSYT
ncbi:hypothetical protein C8J57DRAFT_1719443 [Mycena rebaudengoi]|nr:hypothetical protein C8J57DRAFT_1719443 [Mycena rebaudengoi]